MVEDARKERRHHARRRTRLRPGKLLAADGRFLCDCAVLDRSAAGARVRAFAPAPLPEGLFLFEEIERVKWRARLVWSGDAEAGLRFASSAAPVEAPDEIRRLAGRYYALG